MTIQLLETQSELDTQRQIQRDGVTTQTQLEHDGLLEAVLEVQKKLATVAPSRERDWAKDVLFNLHFLEKRFREHVESAGQEDGLFAELAISGPNWIPRIKRLKKRQERLLFEMNSLISQIDKHGTRDVLDFSDIWRRAAAIVNDVRTVQTLENDLIFECFETDLGVGD